MYSKNKQRLCFYSDANEWGGQEILSARIASILADTYDVTFLYSCSRFAEALPENVKQVHLPYASQTPFPILRDQSRKKKKAALEILRDISAKNLIICPGNIERCLPGLWAANRLGIPCVSYLPLAFTQRETFSKFGILRDFLAKNIYKKIQSWIVNTPYQKRLLQRFVPEGSSIQILPNPLAWENSSKPRAPEESFQIGLIGRIYFPQKGQDIAPAICQALKAAGKKAHFHIMGEGPHESKLKQLVHQKNLDENFTFHGWIAPDQVKEFLSEKLNLLLVSSHFESGPIVLFEAIQCGCPILIADAEYTKDYNIPQWMVYQENDSRSAARKILELEKNWSEEEFLQMRKFLFENRTDMDFQRNTKQIFEELFAKGVL